MKLMLPYYKNSIAFFHTCQFCNNLISPKYPISRKVTCNGALKHGRGYLVHVSRSTEQYQRDQIPDFLWYQIKFVLCQIISTCMAIYIYIEHRKQLENYCLALHCFLPLSIYMDLSKRQRHRKNLHFNTSPHN